MRVEIGKIDKKLLICEVKLLPKRLNKNILIQKSVNLVRKFEGYDVEYQLLSIDDIASY